jgi:4-amino-4-deoxy-L-arabinose transferase-like glycosyltransferase
MELSTSATVLSPPVEKTRNRVARVRFLSVNRRQLLIVLTMTALLSLGIFLRLYPSAGYRNLGTDEFGYMVFVKQIQAAGIWNYDAVVRVYVERQYRKPDAVVPATRLGFLVPAAICADLFHLRAFQAIHAVAAASGVLLLLVAALFAYRLGGAVPMLGTTALVATAPLEIYLSQRAMIDGYFAFWAVTALWLAWENLQHPKQAGWLVAYTICLTILVLTKETAAFVVFALMGTLLLNRFLRIGTLTPQLVAATVAGPALAVLILVALVGGFGDWVHFYQMFITKSRANFYSVAAQDGPWYRYAIDFALVSPAIIALATGAMFQLRSDHRAECFMGCFVLLALVSLSCVKYGISLRYAAFCDVPLAWLACSQVFALSKGFSKVRPSLIAASLFLIVSAIGLNQYARIFVRGALYDPITSQLVTTLDMYKSNAAVKAELARQRPSGF